MIDWKDPKAKISKFFTVREALWLPSWEILHVPSEEEKKQILLVAEKMDLIREELSNPIIVHCWIRPKCANAPGSKWDRRNYNAFVGGSPGSAHIEGKAVDFHVARMTCGEVRQILQSRLNDLKIRMENIEGNWVHVDIRDPLPRRSRFFKP